MSDLIKPKSNRRKKLKTEKHMHPDLSINVLAKNSAGLNNWEQLSKIIGYKSKDKKNSSDSKFLMDSKFNGSRGGLKANATNFKSQSGPARGNNPSCNYIANKNITSITDAIYDSNHRNSLSTECIYDQSEEVYSSKDSMCSKNRNTTYRILKKEGDNKRKHVSLIKDTPINSKLKGINLKNAPRPKSQISRAEKEESTLKSNNSSNAEPQYEQRGSATKVIAMDCEMVGTGTNGEDSMIARVSLVNRFGDCLYDAYVKPMEPVTDYRTAVSGIRPTDLAKGKDLFTVQKDVQDILDGRILVGHALKNDLNVLFISHPKWMIRDTAKYRPFRQMFNGQTPSLKKLAEKLLGVQIQGGEHSSVEDAQAAMQIYLLNKREWEGTIKFMKKRKNRPPPPTTSSPPPLL